MDKLTPEQRRKNMQAVKNKNSRIEIILGKALWQKGYRYRKNDKTVLGNPYFSKAPLVAGMNNPDIFPLFPYFQQIKNYNYGYTI
ncbi:MAG: very short patch repair endonuclease [Bacteroidales bacterium]|jgi:DNA mismatch endonuclease (patch repair protein)|nr:very short patch repair endonuclease [Bacteroidales bacterium]